MLTGLAHRVILTLSHLAVLIAGRIWWIRHQTRRARAAGESPIALLMTLVVESGRFDLRALRRWCELQNVDFAAVAAVYSALLIPEIISIAYDLPSVYVFINMVRRPFLSIAMTCNLNCSFARRLDLSLCVLDLLTFPPLSY